MRSSHSVRRMKINCNPPSCQAMLLVCVLTPYTCFAPSIHIMVLLLLLLLFCSLCFEQTQQHQSFLHSSLIHLFRPTQRTLPPRESSPLSRASPFLSQFPLVACLLFFLLLPPPPLFRARSNHTHFSLPSIPPSHFFFLSVLLVQCGRGV